MNSNPTFGEAMADLIQAMQTRYGPLTGPVVLCAPQRVALWDRPRYARRRSVRAAVRRAVRRGERS